MINSVKNKLASAVLASSIAISSIPMNASAANINHNDNSSSTSQKSKESFMDKIKKVTIFGSSIFVVAFLCKFALDKHYDYNYVLDKYIFGSRYSCQSLSFDDWFTKLGGTQSDIDAYLVLKARFDSGELQDQIQDSDYITIDKDVPRNSLIRGDNQIWYNDKGKEMLGRILKIRMLTSGKSYVQGHDRFATLVIRKFLSKHFTEDINDDTEAKIYYIYDKLVSLSMADRVLAPDTGYAAALDITNDALSSRFFKYRSIHPDAIEWPNIPGTLAVFLKPYITSCMDSISAEQSLMLYDNIISDENIVRNGTIDIEKGQRTLAIIANAMWNKIYFDHKQEFDQGNGNNNVERMQSLFGHFDVTYQNRLSVH